MVTRRHIKVQHFDVTLSWAGRYKKVHYSKFFGLSDPLGTCNGFAALTQATRLRPPHVPAPDH
jgi:hypothetical protein